MITKPRRHIVNSDSVQKIAHTSGAVASAAERHVIEIFGEHHTTPTRCDAMPDDGIDGCGRIWRAFSTLQTFSFGGTGIGSVHFSPDSEGYS